MTRHASPPPEEWLEVERHIREAMKKTKEPDSHFACLQALSAVLNLHQDIEDVYDEKISDVAKLKRIKRLNGRIGSIAAKYLPG